MPKFEATIKVVKAGVKGLTVNAAVNNAEGWEAELEKVEVSGVKTIVKDLDTLKKHLQKEEVDGDVVRKLIAKLGKETVTIAGKADKGGDKIKSLGGAAGAEDAPAKK